MDEDTKQRVKGGFTFILEFYKICMGTFLTVFVPHQCYETTPQGEQSTICTVSYNVYHGDDYHRRVIWFNLCSFVVFGLMYYTEIKRENWCINYLDIDYTKPSDNLDDEIELYPVFKSKMRQLNKNYDLLVKACYVTQLFNIAISVADIGRSWAGSASFTPMLSYIILIAMKLYTTITVAHASLKKERAFSAYLKEPKTYNTIDKDHRNVAQESVISLEVTEEKPAEIEMTEEKPAEIEMTEEKPAEIEMTEEKPAEVEVTEEKPAEVEVTEEKPAEVEVTDNKPVEVEVEVTDNKPVEVEVTDNKPVEVEVEVTDNKPVEVEVTEETTEKKAL